MAETSGLYATSYVDHSVVCGKAYSYTVRACCEKNGNRIYGTYDPQGIVGRAVPEAPTLTESSNSSTSVSFVMDKGVPAQMAIIFIERQMPMARGHMSIPSGRTIPAIRTPV